MSPEEKKKMYDAIGYDESSASTSAYPTDVREPLPDILNRAKHVGLFSLVHRHRSGHSIEDARREYMVETQPDRHAVSQSLARRILFMSVATLDTASLLVLQFQTLVWYFNEGRQLKLSRRNSHISFIQKSP